MKKIFIFYVFTYFMVLSSLGQSLVEKHYKNSKLKYAKFYETLDKEINSDFFFKNYLSLDEQNHFVATDTIYSPDSTYIHVKYKQYYDKYCVENAIVTLTYCNNRILRFHGNYVPITKLYINQDYSYGQIEETYNEYYKKVSDKSVLYITPIIIEDTNSVSNAMLCYKVQSNESDYIDRILYLSASDLSIVKETYTPASNFNATLHTRYNGIRQGNQSGTDSMYALIDYNAAVQILKIDSGITNLGVGIPNTFYNKTNIWNMYSDSTYPQHILDAYWAACVFSNYMQTTYMYPKHYFQRCWNNNQQQYVVYDTMTRIYVALNTFIDNTMWKRQVYESQFKLPGQDVVRNIIIVGAQGPDHKPKASIDEVVHEYAHIFSYQSWSPNLSQFPNNDSYDNRLAEACADIWAAVITSKIYPNEEEKIWKIGEDIVLPTSGKNCVRNLAEPNSVEAETQMNSNACQPQIGNAYVQSGVISHWFYLLTHGYDDLGCDGICYNFPAIPIDSAAKLLYYCERVYFENEMEYQDICRATLEAAENFAYPELIRKSVLGAWNSLGVKPSIEGIEQFGLSLDGNNNGIYTIDQNLVIDSTKILIVNGELRCSSNARLIVRPGGKLIVDGGTLTSACAGEMWQGVQVLGNGGLSQNAANQGWLELKNGALIENARCAVQAEPGAVVKATNTAFRNNGRAVNLMPYVETMPGGSVRGNLSGFGNCTFTTDGDNLFAENGCEFTEHVRMSEVNGIEFHSCGFSDATAGGFTTHRGIYAQDAGFTLTKTCPSNIFFTDCVCAENYSRYNTFSGFNTAIEANTSGNQYAIEIDQTRFSGNGTAVRINGNNFVTVTRDTFDLTQSVSQPPFVTGLYLNNCSGYKVEGNHFKGLVMSNVGSTTGVIVNNSGSADNTIYRNSFSSLNYGVQVRGDNGGAHGGLQEACGSFSNVNNTIYLAGGATMKSTDNVTINNCASTLCGITPGFPGHPFPVNAAGANPANFAGANDHSTLQTEVYYAAVRGIMADTVVDLGALQQWHTVAQPIADRYSLTETDFQMGLVDDVESGDADYAQFHAMKAQLRDGRMVNWREITEAQKTELQEIAERNSGRASEMAKGVLCFYHGICLEDGDLSVEEPQGGTKSAKTAINKAENAGLYVYPNPTDGDLNVEITDGTQITAITLCDLQGRVVETQNFASQHGASLNGGTTVITMQNIPAGVYILTVTDLNGVIYHQKIIKK